MCVCETDTMTEKDRERIKSHAIIYIFRNQALSSHVPINDGPISLNSTVLNPFSPVPTKAITKPIATVPNPT